MSSQRLNDLERALNTLSKFAFYGDLKQLEEFKSIGAEFAKIAEKPAETPVDKQQLLRENLAKLMQLSLVYWQENTGKNKFDLAEKVIFGESILIEVHAANTHFGQVSSQKKPFLKRPVGNPS